MNTLTGFAELLERTSVAASATAALDTAAALIEREAKAEIGSYQRSNLGPYDPWAELAQATKDERVRLGFTPNDPLLRTGELRDSIGRQVEGLEAVIGSTSDVMVYQELGTSRIPPRPVLGLAAIRKNRDVLRLIGNGLGAAMFAKWLGRPAPAHLEVSSIPDAE